MGVKSGCKIYDGPLQEILKAVEGFFEGSMETINGVLSHALHNTHLIAELADSKYEWLSDTDISAFVHFFQYWGIWGHMENFPVLSCSSKLVMSCL